MNRSIRTAAVAVAAALGAMIGLPAVAGAGLLVDRSPRPPAERAQVGEPVQAYIRLDPNESINLGAVIYTVPLGKRLEVQHVSFIDDQATVGISSVAFSVIKDDVTRQIFLPTHPQGAVTDVASEMVTAYADPGTEVFASVHTDQPSHTGMWMTFSGVLFDT